MGKVSEKTDLFRLLFYCRKIRKNTFFWDKKSPILAGQAPGKTHEI